MKVAIIGGGAAGLMAAATISAQHPEIDVVVIEKNSVLGKKVLISGGGRCNVTTGLRGIRTVLSKYPRGSKFLNSAMRKFPPEAVYAWFESHGVPLKIEEDLRVFPRSNNGHDIVGVFEQIFARAHIRVMLERHVCRVERNRDGFTLFFTQGDPLDVDKVILTTGGQAYRHTGSTGDGYTFAESLGHTITPLAGSLNSFFARETWPQEVSGLSFEKVCVRTQFQTSYKCIGPMLFTHRGVSGPVVFALSSLIAFETYDTLHPMKLSIDVFPDTTSDALKMRLEESIRQHPKKTIVTVLDFFMAKTLAIVLCRELHLGVTSHAAEVSKKDLQRIVQWLKNISLQVIARGAGDEFVTAGGVTLDEVDQRTMESKITSGLYFAGEILDIDGFTGGYNLQASWATGRVAGESVVA